MPSLGIVNSSNYNSKSLERRLYFRLDIPPGAASFTYRLISLYYQHNTLVLKPF